MIELLQEANKCGVSEVRSMQKNIEHDVSCSMWFIIVLGVKYNVCGFKHFVLIYL